MVEDEGKPEEAKFEFTRDNREFYGRPCGDLLSPMYKGAVTSTGGNHRRLWRLPLCLRLASLGRFTEPDSLANTPAENQLERIVARLSPTAIKGKVRSPKPNRITRSRRGRYSNRTWWSPGDNCTPTKLGISITVSVFTPSTVARQFG